MKENETQTIKMRDYEGKIIEVEVIMENDGAYIVKLPKNYHGTVTYVLKNDVIKN